MSYYALLAAWAFAGAFSAPLDSDLASRDIQVTLHFLKPDQTNPSIVAYNNDRTEVIGHSCSTSLTLGAASIAFDVDQRGSGNITVNEREFLIIDNPELSGGVVCGRMYNDLETVVNCEVTALVSSDLPAIDRGSFPGCMSKRSTVSADALDLEATLEGFYRRPTFLPQEQPLAPPDNSTLAERQICGVYSKTTYRIGDGNPHQNPLNIQLSEPMQCGAQNTCSTARSVTRSFSIGWSASATAWSWLNAGFAVEASIDTGNNYQCDGNPNDYFAVWKKQAQTAYTVRNRQITCAGAQDNGGNYVMWSPNRDNRGGYYYCVYGRQYVRWIGDRWLDTTPIPGGPP